MHCVCVCVCACVLCVRVCVCLCVCDYVDPRVCVYMSSCMGAYVVMCE